MLDKEKRKAPPERWMHRRWFAYLLGILFFCSGVAYVLDVPVLLLMFMRPNALLFSFITLGATTILFLMYGIWDWNYHHRFYLVPTPVELLFSILIVAIASLFFVWCVRRLQRFRRVFRWLVYLNYAPVFLLLVFLRPSHPGDGDPRSRSECLYSLSDTIKIEVEHIQEHDGWSVMAEGNTYRLSRDGGQTWDIFIVESNYLSPCEQFADDYSGAGLLNENMFWVWRYDRLILTRTGGTVWEQSLYFDDYCTQLEEVQFENEQVGTATANYRCGTSPGPVTYHTFDGGYTWQLEQ